MCLFASWLGPLPLLLPHNLLQLQWVAQVGLPHLAEMANGSALIVMSALLQGSLLSFPHAATSACARGVTIFCVRIALQVHLTDAQSADGWLTYPPA